MGTWRHRERERVTYSRSHSELVIEPEPLPPPCLDHGLYQGRVDVGVRERSPDTLGLILTQLIAPPM